MSRIHNMIAVALVISVLGVSMPVPARAESGTIDSNVTIGLLVVVVGVLGWVAWNMERADEEDQFQSRALLPLHVSADESAALGFVLDPEVRGDDDTVFTAGLAIGRRF